MKPSLINYFLLFSVLFLLLIRCEDDDPGNHSNPAQNPSVVQFVASDSSTRENASEHAVVISLNRSAVIEGTLKIKFDSTLSKYFITTPASKKGVLSLPIKKGDDRITFKISPIDNSLLDGKRNIVFAMQEVSMGFWPGTRKTYTLTIQDDESPTQQKDSYANFISSNFTIKENNPDWHQLRIHISESPTVDGAVILRAESAEAVYGTNYITEPSFVNGQLTLDVETGTSVVSFKVRTLNNNVISGNLDINFEITAALGNIRKGLILKESFKIKDDELENMPKGYEVGGGAWSLKKTYEYNPSGKVSKVKWESHTPYYKGGTDTYYYNSSNQLTRINNYPGQDLYYYYEGDKIVKEENVDNGTVDRYTEFEYDDLGNVGSYRTFYLQPDGTFTLSFITVLFYYQDGNLYKQLVYTPTADPDQHYLVSTTTFESYRRESNPFPMIVVLPNLNIQKNLPAVYRYEAHGHDLLYHFSYEFRPDGNVGKRIATQGTTTEIAAYDYY